MRAGDFDRLIDIQRKTVTQSSSGAEVEAWVNIATRRPATMWPVKGDEKFAAPQRGASEQIAFRARWSTDIAALSPNNRVIYPALNDGDEITERRIHDIVAVHELGRRDGLRILTIRRVDQ